MEAYANGRDADGVAEHVVAGGLGHEDVDMAARVSRGLAGGYQRASAEGINRLTPTWQQLHTAAPLEDTPLAMTLRAHTKAVDFAAERAGDMIKQIDDTTRADVQRVVRDAVALHWDQDKLAEKLQDAGTFTDARALMIARTEVSHAINQGMIEAGRQARDTGRHIQKMWVVDGDPCPLCEEAAAEGEVDLDEDFGDSGDSPPLHPNCMCEIELFEPDEEDDDE